VETGDGMEVTPWGFMEANSGVRGRVRPCGTKGARGGERQTDGQTYTQTHDSSFI